MEERLQKILAHAGVASRRACEELILSGKVKVNGRVVQELGTKFDPESCRIEVAGRIVSGAEKPVYILMHKPAGFVTTVSDPRGRRTVLHLLEGVSERIYPVGRLDYNTSGILLMTNDGSLTNNLIHPSREVKKTYRAQVAGVPAPGELKMLRAGVFLEDGKTSPALVKVIKEENGNAVIDITIHEGKNRQVRRMFERIGHPVLWLKRISFGFLTLGDLKPGEWRYLNLSEINKLKELKGRE